MPIKAVADLFEARLAANWTETVIVAYDTVADTPDADAFVVQQFPVALGIRPLLGRRFLEEGVYRLVLNVNRGIGQEQGLIWSDGLRAIFNNVKFSGQLETLTPDGPIVDDNNEEGDWISYSLIVPYRYQYNG